MSDYLDYINQYISGELSEEERRAFEARLASDKELNEQYQLVLKAKDFIKARSVLEEIENDPELPLAEAQVEEYLSRLNQSDPGTGKEPAGNTESQQTGLQSRSGNRVRKVFFWAIPAAAVIGIILIIRSFTGTDPNIRLYKKYYRPLSANVLEVGLVRGSNTPSIQAGINCYEKKDYLCAINNFRNNPEAAFYLGLAQLGAGNYNEALESFLDFERNHHSHPGVNWYLSLTYLHLNKLDEAENRLNSILATSSPYYSDPGKLKKRLEKIKAAEKN
jgi:tetratricopeptide (TPR) repeat protein